MEQGAQEAVGYRWTFANVEFDDARWELTVAGLPVELERKPLELLAQLLRHAGEVLTKDELLESVWTGRIVVEASLTNAVGKLRKALGDEAQAVIVNVPRVGYRLEGRVSRKAVYPLPVASMLRAGDAVPRRPNFRLVAQLARQEASEVWRAEQPKTHEVRVFKFSLDGTRVAALKREVTLSRLLRDTLGERETYVRVLDWDFDAAPYFIESEYGGQALDQWLAQPESGFGRGERLEFMARLADAVAAAHEVGVLHKDLKPANVLVHGGPGDWSPRLTDFGSGRMLDSGRLEALGITQLGLTLTQSITSDSGSGTPLYLAPEVISGQSPTIKSDLYALGVMLYQLLAGDFRRPLSPGWEADIDDPLLRTDIADFANGDPAKRPASARDLAERLRSIEARRLRLDLEQAVQDRVARSERQLALARARRPWIAAAGILLASGLALSSTMYAKANRAQRESETQAQRAEAIGAFYSKDVVDAANPFYGGKEGVTVLEALERAESGLGKRFANQPLEEAAVRRSLAETYDQVGRKEKAIANFQRAATLFAAALGPADFKTIEARLYGAMNQAQMGRIDLAEAEVAKVKRLLSRQARPDPMAQIHALNTEGMLEANGLRFDKAATAFAQALTVADRTDVLERERYLRLKQNLATTMIHAGQSAQVIPLMKDVVDEYTTTKGRADPSTIDARLILAQARLVSGDLEQALADSTTLAEDTRKVFDAGNPAVGDVCSLRADALVQLHRYSEASLQYACAYKVRVKMSGDKSAVVAETLMAWSNALRLEGRASLARDKLAPAWTSVDSIYGQDQAGRAALGIAYAFALVDSGEAGEAHRIAGSIDVKAITAGQQALNWPARWALLRAKIAAGRGDALRAKSLIASAVEIFSKGPEQDGQFADEAKRLIKQYN